METNKLASELDDVSGADRKRKQKEKLQKLVTVQTKQTANLIKFWLEKQKTAPTSPIGTRGRVD